MSKTKERRQEIKGKLFALGIGLVLMVMSLGCALIPGSTTITGSGNVVTREEPIADFDKVDVSHAFHVDISQGDAFSVIVRVDDNLIEYLEVVKQGETLKIGLEPGLAPSVQDATMEAEVTMPELVGLELSGVVPPDEKEQLEPILSAEGSIGMDIRLLDGDAVIMSCRPGSPASQAGLRPGFVVQRVNGKTVEQWAGEVWPIPPLHERNERKRVTAKLQEQFYGPLDTTVELVYLDAHGESHETVIQRAKRDGKVVLGAEFPPFYVEFESRRLDEEIGYIRFNAFIPPVDQRFPEALESLRGTRGLIIDLRGNHGGVFPVRKGLAEQLVQERTLFWSYKGRDSIQEVYLEPVQNAYGGPLVVLIDVMSASSAEEFSGALQAIGRAVVVGERSAGVCVVGDVMQLPNGAVLMYPRAQTRTADGTVLEGRGVIPDIEVALDRSLLLQGIDSQLEAAIGYVKNEVQK